MKRILSVIMFIVFVVITGCNDDAVTKVVVKSAARHAGYAVAENDAALAAKILLQAEVLKAAAKGDPEKFVETLFPAAVEELQNSISDPLIAQDVADLVDIVVSADIDEDGNAIDTEAKASIYQAAIEGFCEGITRKGAETAMGK